MRGPALIVVARLAYHYRDTVRVSQFKKFATFLAVPVVGTALYLAVGELRRVTGTDDFMKMLEALIAKRSGTPTN